MNSGVYSFSMMVVGCLGLCVGSVIFLNEFIGHPFQVVEGTRLVEAPTLTVALTVIAVSFLLMAFASLVFLIARSKHNRHVRHLR